MDESKFVGTSSEALGKLLTSNSETKNSDEIQDFQIVKFLKEFTKLKKLGLMTLDDFKSTLSKRFHLFLETHTSCITILVVTSDNKYLVSGSMDTTVRIWRLHDKGQEAILTGHTSYVNCLALTSNNKKIVSGSDDNTIRLWSIRKQTQVAMFKGHTSSVNCLAITSDNALIISGSSDHTIRLWSLGLKMQIGLLEGHQSFVNGIAITSDNRYVISGSTDPRGLHKDNTLRIWNIKEQRIERVLHDFGGFHICGILLSKDDKFLIVSCKDRTVIISDYTELIKVYVLETNIYGERTAVITSDNKYIITGHYGSLKIWNTQEDYNEVKRYSFPNLRSIALTSDNQCVIIGSLHNYMQILNLKDGKKEFFHGHARSIDSVAISGDYKYLASGSSGNIIKIWNVHKKIQEFSFNICYKSFTIASNCDFLIVGRIDADVRIWNLKKRNEKFLLTGHISCVSSVATTINSKFIISSDDDTIRVWRMPYTN